jgi:hypothetical protein
MTKTEMYYFGLLLDYLLILESSLSDLDKKWSDLDEVVLANNQLLGFLAKTLTDTGVSSGSSAIQLSEELSEALTKLSADKEKWGES